MPGPHFTIDDEKAQRAALATFLATMPILGHVFDRRRLITDRRTYAERLGWKIGTHNSEEREIRYIAIDFLKVVDSKDEGFDDCPVPIITYNLHIFHEFKDNRAAQGDADSNSTDDFISAILTLRDAVLNRRDYDFGKADPVTMAADAQLGNDGFTDCEGHFADLQIEISSYANQE